MWRDIMKKHHVFAKTIRMVGLVWAIGLTVIAVAALFCKNDLLAELLTSAIFIAVTFLVIGAGSGFILGHTVCLLKKEAEIKRKEAAIHEKDQEIQRLTAQIAFMSTPKDTTTVASSKKGKVFDYDHPSGTATPSQKEAVSDDKRPKIFDVEHPDGGTSSEEN